MVGKINRVLSNFIPPTFNTCIKNSIEAVTELLRCKISVCVYVCVGVCTACVCACTVYMYLCVCVRARVCVCMDACVSELRTYIISIILM